MKNTKLYMLKNSLDSCINLIKSKRKVSFTFFGLLLLMTVFSSPKIEAESMTHIIQQAQLNNHHKVSTASVTYRTVHSFHDKKRLTVKSKNNYVVFSPKIIKPESNISYLYSDQAYKKSFYTASFFEKAMRFNDTLQTWVE